MKRHDREAQRAEAFADALGRGSVVDGGDERLQLETSLLVSVAEALCRAELESPRPEFAVALRERLMQEAPAALAVEPRRAQRVVRVKPVTTPAVLPHRFRRRLGAAAAVFALAGGSFGLVSTSAQALPGDMLYAVKRGVERAELSLSQGQVAVGRERLTQANERLWEVQRLAGGRDVDAREAALINSTLSEFSMAAENGAATMLAAYAARGDETVVIQVNDFAATSGAVLTELFSDLPAATEEAYEGAATTISRLASDAQAACNVCAASAVSSIPTSLQASVGDLVSPSGEAPSASGPSEDKSDDDGAAKGSDPKASDAPPATRAPRVPQETVDPALPDTSTGVDDGDEVVKPSLTTPVKKITDPLLKGLLGDASDGSESDLVPGTK